MQKSNLVNKNRYKLLFILCTYKNIFKIKQGRDNTSIYVFSCSTFRCISRQQYVLVRMLGYVKSQKKSTNCVFSCSTFRRINSQPYGLVKMLGYVWSQFLMFTGEPTV